MALFEIPFQLGGGMTLLDIHKARVFFCSYSTFLKSEIAKKNPLKIEWQKWYTYRAKTL